MGGWQSEYFTAVVTTIYMEDQKKTLHWSGGLPKEPQLNFLFQLLQPVWIVSVVRNKSGTLYLMDGK